MELTSSELQHRSVANTTAANWKISTPVKHTMLYSGVFIFMAMLLGFLFGNGWAGGKVSGAGRFVFAFVFVLIGLLYYISFPKIKEHLYKPGTLNGLIYSFVLAFLVTDSVLLLFYAWSVQSNELAIAAGCAFVLPYIINQCRICYQSIEQKEYTKWVIPPGTVPDKRKSLLLNSIFFRIKMKVKYFDVAEELFSVNLPRHLTLCTVFVRFLYDQQDAIETADEHKQPYAWRFSVKGMLGKRILDPDSTLEKNRIKGSDVILIERIKLS